jgi:diguanylate cyclase (GGDEF)-like protein
MQNPHHTIEYADSGQSGGDEKRTLVQIHPLDIDRGPIELSNDRMTIGRSSHCDLRICDHSISRQHAEIRVTDQDCLILDLESTNGITVNGSRVQTHPLQSGDTIQLGRYVFRFLANGDFESQYHEAVYSMMTRDGLTDAYNKRYLTEMLEREVARCKRHARPLALTLIDVDYFKSVNDTYGHSVGDQVLQKLSARLQSNLRQDDLLARFGGEEFAIVQVEADLEHAAIIAERCRVAIESEPFETTGGPVQVTISLGIAAPSPTALGSCEELLTEADERLYEAKSGGRNRTVC